MPTTAEFTKTLGTVTLGEKLPALIEVQDEDVLPVVLEAEALPQPHFDQWAAALGPR